MSVLIIFCLYICDSFKDFVFNVNCSTVVSTNGILTKSPSFELKEVARRIQTTGTKFESPLEGFFLVLVKHEATDSTPHCTPAIMPQPKSVKISNKCKYLDHFPLMCKGHSESSCLY